MNSSGVMNWITPPQTQTNLDVLSSAGKLPNMTLPAPGTHGDGVFGTQGMGVRTPMAAAADILNFWLLYTVNSYLPLINHIFLSKPAHPERLFSAMLTLAGALTTFSTSIQYRDLPEYDHNALELCFADLNAKLRKLLETVIPTNVVWLPLKLAQPSIYSANLDDEKYLRNTHCIWPSARESSRQS